MQGWKKAHLPCLPSKAKHHETHGTVSETATESGAVAGTTSSPDGVTEDMRQDEFI